MGIGEDRAALVAAIAPRDGVEAALAAQMAACHEAALACLANARRQDLPESARTAELRTGARLMALFTQQLGALERHRVHLRREQEAAESAAHHAALRRRFAEQDAEREAEEAVIYPTRHARRLAARAAVSGPTTGPTTDEAVFERLCARFEQRLSGEEAEAGDEGEAETASVPEAAGAAMPPPAAPEALLSRQQRRALERRRRKEKRRAGIA